MALIVRKIPAAECRRARWKNGGGWTTEIAIEPAGSDLAGDFDWRVSIADIEQDGPFSLFPGVERDLFLLDGNGIELRIDETPHRLDRPLQRVHFSGESNVECTLINGATRDFNVMVRAHGIVAYIAATEPLQNLAIAGPIGSQWLIHCCSGDAELALDGQTLRLGAGDSARIDSPEHAGEFSISSTQRLLAVRFTPRGSND